MLFGCRLLEMTLEIPLSLNKNTLLVNFVEEDVSILKPNFDSIQMKCKSSICAADKRNVMKCGKCDVPNTRNYNKSRHNVTQTKRGDYWFRLYFEAISMRLIAECHSIWLGIY